MKTVTNLISMIVKEPKTGRYVNVKVVKLYNLYVTTEKLCTWHQGRVLKKIQNFYI